MEQSADMTLLVMSCDQYADLHAPASQCIQRYWQNRPYPCLLATETAEPAGQLVFSRTLHSQSAQWSGRLIDALQQIETPYVLIALDDLWLCKPVDTPRIQACIARMQKDGVGAVHLCPTHLKLPDDPASPDDFCIHPFGKPYRVSASPTIYLRSFLLSILCPEDNAWDFERMASFREEGKCTTVLESKRMLYPFISGQVDGAVVRGKWNPAALEFAKKSGLSLDASRRPVLSARALRRLAVKSFLFNLSPDLIVWVQNQLKRITRQA